MRRTAFSFQLSAFSANVCRHILHFLKADSRQLKATPGFTLIELLVVTAILTIVSGVVLANNGRFGGLILLENLAYDVALSIRQAQIYGISVRQFGSGNFDVGYGMHFSIGSPATYVLFADAVSGNGIYDGCPTEAMCELVESTDIERGYHIADLCAAGSGSEAETCGLSELDLFFKRPEPDAYISANGVSGVANPAALNARGRIVLESPRGDRTSVVVEATGQIAIQYL
ncbi:hypothetical protein A3C21_03580 [Candidatus Kaiserbacteria bacterium RIFCSPHIGHO2_02_FULL_59_21]|nr:MAG: hypothetical protein A2766_03640 [Candidatus Kaiserbacteria bacterium RIFCSPHIGHO2_01_FULL_58_22]OGG66761.1 MAG: hypothetical protein A3C21_03580 [Candidatus Kaiserbacteria bacterium RIFCSPHIGHO2_02_FULL_59_21]OGG80732.1 MAG: hypothetical protein A2952_01005 [Candidatus Kaiserbacteria bacterium RIFCSPLOWO2_01_FULL_59_34]OGG84454.1 MAG: hypothetical protein A3I47_02260 [Candidatus Kaiserbacteria bacterium RIFCSPLOWO2_02_FULL_59_19]